MFLQAERKDWICSYNVATEGVGTNSEQDPGRAWFKQIKE